MPTPVPSRDHTHLCPLRFLSFIQDSVYRSLPQAKLGGVPGTYQAVRGYLTLRQAGTAEGLEVRPGGGAGGVVCDCYPAPCRMVVLGASRSGPWSTTVCAAETCPRPYTPSGRASKPPACLTPHTPTPLLAHSHILTLVFKLSCPNSHTLTPLLTHPHILTFVFTP